MAEIVDEWAANGRKNIFNQEVNVVELQSEAGASGAFHSSFKVVHLRQRLRLLRVYYL